MKRYILTILLCIAAAVAAAGDTATTAPKSIQGTWIMKNISTNKGESFTPMNMIIGTMRRDHIVYASEFASVNREPRTNSRIATIVKRADGTLIIGFDTGRVFAVQCSHSIFAPDCY